MNDFWIILTASLVAIPCSILGVFLVLRKMVMVGDAISHAVLPGIVIAYLVTKSFDSVYMVIGAGIIGIITTFLIEFLHRKARVQEDASIGVTFTWMFSLGVILISVFTRNTDLDQDCVLHGEIINVPFNLWITDNGINLGPVNVWTLGIFNIIIISFVTLCYKELYITTFDTIFATAIGISTTLWNYLLMGAVSFVTVASFESVGAILVIAFIVGPPATAFLLTDNLKKMIAIAMSLGITASILGYQLAALINADVASSITTIIGIQFAITLFFSPQHGILMSKKNTKSDLTS